MRLCVCVCVCVCVCACVCVSVHVNVMLRTYDSHLYVRDWPVGNFRFSGSWKGEGFLFLPELRSCVKVEEAVLGSPSLTVLMVSVDVKQH